ncbi:cysteine proteinase [Microthyrium microscopicum]|uniref:ubiquitinyl hydrolase 1 n=1 Tax=Microthyrium microscopicum TaxID=703497 RepID=A0A6A6U6J0_9PEZI|nr:cysteine proteinase [Microthyrium microscopicum]
MNVDTAWAASKPSFSSFQGTQQLRKPALETWIDAKLILPALIALASAYHVTGGTAHYRILFFVKRVLLGLKDMAYRFSTGLIRPTALIHSGGKTPGSAAGRIIARTGLPAFAQRMIQSKPLGLGNVDFSCYQNSVVQGLSSLVSFPKFLDQIIEDGTNGTATSTVLTETMYLLNTPQNSRMMWLPCALKSMSSIEQQDAQEYYSKILDQIDKEAINRRNLASKSNGLSGLLDVSDLVETPDTKAAADNKLQNPLEGLIAQRVGCLQCGHSDGISLIPFNNLTLPLGRYNTYHISELLDEYSKLEFIEGVQCPKCTLLRAQANLKRMLSQNEASPLVPVLTSRLAAVEEALANDDFADETLIKKCSLSKNLWESTTKSKQTAIARPPKAFAIHVNRSVFDEYSGAMYKNTAQVRFPVGLDLGPWCVNELASENLESKQEGEAKEIPVPDSIADPRSSMLPPQPTSSYVYPKPSDWQYELRAAVIHHGRHENGHYICYRKYPPTHNPTKPSEPQSKPSFPGWWELSDDDVDRVSDRTVFHQGQVFMLFYELITESSGKDLADLNIACRTPLPADDDDIFADAEEDQQVAPGEPTLNFEQGHVLNEAINISLPDDSDNSDSLSSDDGAPTPKVSQAPQPVLPKMWTGLVSKEESEEGLDRAVRVVDVV